MKEEEIVSEIYRKINEYTLLTGGLGKSINIAFVPHSMWEDIPWGAITGSPLTSVNLAHGSPPRWQKCEDGSFILEDKITVFIAESISAIFVGYMKTPVNVFDAKYKGLSIKDIEYISEGLEEKPALASTANTSKATFILLESGLRIDTSEIVQYSLNCADEHGNLLGGDQHAVRFVLKNGYIGEAVNDLKGGRKLIDVLDYELLRN